jgi:hypothetical protein
LALRSITFWGFGQIVLVPCLAIGVSFQVLLLTFFHDTISHPNGLAFVSRSFQDTIGYLGPSLLLGLGVGFVGMAFGI